MQRGQLDLVLQVRGAADDAASVAVAALAGQNGEEAKGDLASAVLAALGIRRFGPLRLVGALHREGLLLLLLFLTIGRSDETVFVKLRINKLLDRKRCWCTHSTQRLCFASLFFFFSQIF